MRDDIKCRMARYYKNKEYECWSIQYDLDGKGFQAFDIVVLHFVDEKEVYVKALFLSQFEDSLNSENVLAYILALFEDLTDGEGSFVLKKKFDTKVDDYWPEDLIDMINLI